MNRYWAMFLGVLSMVIGGCSSHQPAALQTTGKKVVAYTVEDFQKEGIRLCPFGFDVNGPIPVFVEGRENIRYIRCRML